MKSKRRKLFIALTVLALAAVAACMMVIGRGHEIYLDNKTLEGYEGQDYKAFDRWPSWASGSGDRPSGSARALK